MKGNIAIIENHIISTNTVREKLTRTLMEEGYNVTILSTGSAKELALAQAKGFNVIDVGTSNTKINDILRYMRKVRSALRLVQADVCLTFTMRPAIWGNLLTRWMKIPTITNITGIGPLAESESLVYKIARLLYRFVLKKTAVVFFQNHDDLHVFLGKKFVTPQQTRVIPGSGVDYEHFAPVPQKRKDDKFVFLFISRLIKDKGITEYVSAAEKMLELDENVTCQVLGPYYSQNLKENTITEKQIMHWLDHGIVNYLGSATDIRPFIAEADCIVLPSYREGMSNVLLEAGSMEKPCITTNITGCREIVVHNETGLLCQVKSAEDLLAKMIQMKDISAEARKAMGIKARERIVKMFAKKIVLDAYKKEIAALFGQYPQPVTKIIEAVKPF